jgi:hypothetical protein
MKPFVVWGQAALVLALPAFLALVPSTALADPSLHGSSGFEEEEDPPVVQNDLSGPRFGGTFARDGRASSQFGWHAEHQASPGRHGPWFIVETVLLVAGLERSHFVPTATLVFGLRTPSGFEFGVGPSVTLGGSESEPVRSGIVYAAGHSFRLGGIRVPVNLAYAPGREGDDRWSLVTGWAIRDRARENR